MRTIKSFISLFAFSLILASAAVAQTSLTSLDGARVDLQAQTGKVVIMAIGASWLPLSGKQVEYTNRLAKKYAGKDVVIYFVAIDSANAKSKNFASSDALRSFATTNKLNVPVLRDPDGALTLKRFKVDQIPSFVILDKTGNIVSEQFGGITTDTKFDVSVPIAKVVDKLL
ncbi:MAG: TlpA disulfide reductase family protein [Pyrinomonadaceae bacterium]